MPERPAAPSLDRGFHWLNTDRPLDFGADLKGHVVLLDFWTYCCINCMHVLPDLAFLEDKYAAEPFAVIGVHSNKFDNEGTRRNVRAAVLRYEIAHPVVVDEQMGIWRSFGVTSWPTRVLVDPEGCLVGAVPGEGHLHELDEIIGRLLTEHRRKGTLADGPLQLRAEAVVPTASRLRFPGKVLADEAGRRVFISDSNHNRIVVTTWPAEDGSCDLLQVIGSGEVGLVDGPADTACFDHPQGVALDGNALYVADTENHAIRHVDLTTWAVTTVSGTGDMSNDRQGGGAGTQQGLNSPWDVTLRDGRLAIAMAGTHQLWVFDPATQVAQVLAGSGQEDVIDGPAPHAALAQPSGLAPIGDVLYFADSETSAVRGLDVRTRAVFTVIGTGLFEFGDADDTYPHALLQHPLGIAAWGEQLIVADTYNHKLKIVDPRAQSARTLAGLGVPAARSADGALGLYEPGGVSVAGDCAFVADTNNHRIVRVDLRTGAWAELVIRGLDRPGERVALFATHTDAVLILPDAPVELALTPALPDGARPNPEAPLSVRVTAGDGSVLVNELTAGAAVPVVVTAPRPGPGPWRVELHCAYCTDMDGGLCAPHSVAWHVPVNVGAGGTSRITLREDT